MKHPMNWITLKSEIEGFDSTLLTASDKIDESTGTISKSVESISEASSQLNSSIVSNYCLYWNYSCTTNYNYC